MLPTINITNARKQLHTIAAEVQQGNPIHVANANGNNIVIMSEEDFLAIQETLYLNSIPHLVETILENQDTPLEDMKVYMPDEEW